MRAYKLAVQLLPAQRRSIAFRLNKKFMWNNCMNEWSQRAHWAYFHMLSHKTLLIICSFTQKNMLLIVETCQRVMFHVDKWRIEKFNSFIWTMTHCLDTLLSHGVCSPDKQLYHTHHAIHHYIKVFVSKWIKMKFWEMRKH